MIRILSDSSPPNPGAGHPDRRQPSRRRIVSAVFHDPDAAGRAYDSVVELGYANEEIAACAAGDVPAGGVVLALEPRCEEEAQRIADRWLACGAPEVAFRFLAGRLPAGPAHPPAGGVSRASSAWMSLTAEARALVSRARRTSLQR